MVFCLVKDGNIKRVGHPIFEKFIGLPPSNLDAWWKSNETDNIEKPKSLNEQNADMEQLESEQHINSVTALSEAVDSIQKEDDPTEMPRNYEQQKV